MTPITGKILGIEIKKQDQNGQTVREVAMLVLPEDSKDTEFVTNQAVACDFGVAHTQKADVLDITIHTTGGDINHKAYLPAIRQEAK